jgi:hypothetical protein
MFFFFFFFFFVMAPLPFKFVFLVRIVKGIFEVRLWEDDHHVHVARIYYSIHQAMVTFRYGSLCASCLALLVLITTIAIVILLPTATDTPTKDMLHSFSVPSAGVEQVEQRSTKRTHNNTRHILLLGTFWEGQYMTVNQTTETRLSVFISFLFLILIDYVSRVNCFLRVRVFHLLQLVFDFTYWRTSSPTLSRQSCIRLIYLGSCFCEWNQGHE